jgi:hypothetical protein
MLFKHKKQNAVIDKNDYDALRHDLHGQFSPVQSRSDGGNEYVTHTVIDGHKMVPLNDGEEFSLLSDGDDVKQKNKSKKAR